MKRIESFSVDHTRLPIGIYLSRTDRDGEIRTYDIRMKKPNGGDYLSVPSLHTIEHLFATYARNSAFADHVVYVGPMGCCTGFYLIVDRLPDADVITLVRDSLQFIADFTGDIPGATEPECGNYRAHDLAAAKRDILPLLSAIDGREMTLRYPE